jgi:transposase
LNLDEETVAKWARQKTYCQHLRARRKSKLDPYKPIIQRWLEQHPYSAAQIFQRLRAEEGYTGGFTILADYVRSVRRVRALALLTLAFAPGECAQVDWGCAGSMAVGSTRRRLSFFVMVLCYSRLCYLEFSLGEATEHFLSAHQNAFQFLGGVPLKVLIDNPKTAVLKHPSGEKSLRIREVRNAAASAARKADVVILSVSGHTELPVTIRAWLDLWLRLLDKEHPEQYRPTRRNRFFPTRSLIGVQKESL